jgi:hypothetical protein
VVVVEPPTVNEPVPVLVPVLCAASVKAIAPPPAALLAIDKNLRRDALAGGEIR